MNNFFKHNDKVYSENLNDSVLVGNAFSWSISIDLPTDSDALFPASSDVVKAKVADVYATPNSNLSIGSTIENSSGSSQVYRLTVYPNFNRFGGFTFVSLEGDGSVIITEKGGTSPVRNNLDYSNLGNVTELKTLREYDLVVTIPSGGEVTGLSFGFQSTTGGANASISQANVSGLVDDLSSLESGKADTEHTHSSSDVTESTGLPNIGTSANASQSVINGAVDEKVGSLSTSITNLERVFFTEITPSAITSASTWTNVNNGKIRLHRVGNICIAFGAFQLKAEYPSAGWKQIATLPIGYKSTYAVELRNGALSVGKIADRLQVNGYNISIFCNTANTESTEYISFDLVWATNDNYPSQ